MLFKCEFTYFGSLCGRCLAKKRAGVYWVAIYLVIYSIVVDLAVSGQPEKPVKRKGPPLKIPTNTKPEPYVACFAYICLGGTD